MIQAVIFDMDGLLIDSEPYWNQADEEFFTRHGKKFKNETKDHITGMGQKEVADYFKEKFGILGTEEEITRERKTLMYNYLLPNLRLMSGALELIQNISQKGYKMAVATGGHTKEKAEMILQKLEIRQNFYVVISSDDVARGKPFPDVFLTTSEKLEVPPAECLVLEDAPNGIVAAKAAQMTAYGINQEEGYRKRLQLAGADAVYKSLREVAV